MPKQTQAMIKEGHQLVVLVSAELDDKAEAIRIKRGHKAALADVDRDALRA